ncbi:MAG TPA: AI-2E family transporter [Verrucomicrobiae bacterium]|nr:AI-2E family transporter [Verrucomicrobiae bacterium]
MPGPAVHREKTLPPWIALVSVGFVVALLYWAQPVLIPVALSILLSFLLSPIVDGLQRLRVPRIPAVILVVLLACCALGAVGWITVRQIVSFANDLPQYQDNIVEKIGDLKRFGKGGAIGKVQQTVEDVKQQIDKEDGVKTEKKAAPAPTAPAPSAWPLSSGAGRIVELIASAGLVVILVIFMLIDRVQLRNRLIRVVGFGRMNVTTKALEEVAQRISRYLLMQSMINGTYGLAVGLSLYFVGLPYALLWGLLAGLLRFIPYAGVWIGLLVPSVLAWAVFSGWLWPLIVVGLFLTLEFAVAMILEPLLYGHSAGVSQVALLIAIAFWAWIWGPVGMIMATPMTVCLVVLGKYIPQLSFLVVLMSDEPVMQTETTYYQRLLASDYDEAAEIVENYLEGDHPPAQVYDQILLPALYQAKVDYRRGKLTAEDESFIQSATGDILEEIDVEQLKQNDDGDGDAGASNGKQRKHSTNVTVLGCAARGRNDSLALRMLERLLEAERCDIKVASRAAELDLEKLTAREETTLICIASVAPSGMAQTRHLAKRLRARLPKAKIVVGRWGLANEFHEIEEQRKLLLAAGADQVTATLMETRALITQFYENPKALVSTAHRPNHHKDKSAKT